MNNPEFVLENKMHVIIRDLWIKTDNLISARRQDRVIVNKKEIKKTCRIIV